MQKKIKLLTLLLACAVTGQAQKQSPALADKTLVSLFSVFSKTDGYTYEIRTRSGLLSDPKKTSTENTTYYHAAAPFIVYSDSGKETFYLCREGQFKADHAAKQVYYKIFESDTAFRQSGATYLQQVNRVLDTLFLSNAFIAAKRSTKTAFVYRLTYAPESMFRSLSLSCRRSDSIPDSLSYVFERPMPAYGNGGRTEVVRQEIKASGYRRQVPAQVSRLQQQSGALLQYLQQEYKTYTLKNI